MPTCELPNRLATCPHAHMQSIAHGNTDTLIQDGTEGKLCVNGGFIVLKGIK